jgi:hypothetical protein
MEEEEKAEEEDAEEEEADAEEEEEEAWPHTCVWQIYTEHWRLFARTPPP